MQKRIRKCTVTVFAILLIIVFSACSQEEANESNEKDDEPKPSTEQPSPTEGGTLTVGVMDEVRIDPVGFDKTRSEYTAAEQLVYQGLFSYSADQQLKPQLIEEYQYKVAEEEKQLVLTLKKGISWHDGKPVTTDDIVYTLQTYLNPYYYGIWGDDLDVISGVSNYRSFRDETISGVSVDREKNQVLIRLDRYDLSFLHALTAPLLPKHQLEEKSFSEIERLSAEGKLLGTGPFRLDGMEEGSVRFQRFDDYYVQTPYLEEIVMLEVNPSLSFEEWSQKGIDLMKVGPLDEKQLRNRIGWKR